MEKLLFSLVIFFSYSLVVSYRTENIIIYGSTISCFILCFYYCLKILKIKAISIKVTKEESRLILFLLVYMLCTFLLGIYLGMENKSVYKVINNNVFIGTFILMLIQLENYSSFFIRLSKLTSYIFIVIGLFSIFLYINKIYGVNLSFNAPFISIMNQDDMLAYFKEIRFQSIFSHKTKFSFYCIIGIFFLSINKVISTKLRILGIIILLINIILTNSITSMLAAGLLIWLSIDLKKLNLFWRYSVSVASAFIFIPYVFKVFTYSSNVRDLDTLGSRGIIWTYAIEFYYKHPLGVIDNWYFYTIGNSVLFFKGAHNVFLNELLDYGVIGGSLFLIIYILYFYSMYKLDRRTWRLVVPVTILFMIDNILYYDIVPVFWFTYILTKVILSANDNIVNNSFRKI